MKHKTPVVSSLWILILLALLLAGCATRQAPDFGGRWKSINHYAASPEEIPLHHSYVFASSPMDGTLKTMLDRWARDSKMKLSYLHSSDFTLYEPVARIQTNDVQQAVSQLTAAYAGQQVSVTASHNEIVVGVAKVGGEAPATTP